MAEAVTEKDVQKSRERVDKLNEQIAEYKATLASNATAGEAEFRKAQLDAEAERLTAELDQLKKLTKPKVQQTETEIISEQARTGILGGPPADDER